MNGEPLITLPEPAGGGTRLQPARPSLLFVDDEPSILTALRVVFRTRYEVAVTTDGFEAIEWMKTRRFDVVVCDQRMPAISGVEVLREARELCPQSIRILLTGYADTQAILGAINEVEVHRFLQKPWDNDKLKQVIDEAARLARRLSQELEPLPAETAQAQAALQTLGQVVPFPGVHRAQQQAPALPDIDVDAVVEELQTVLVIDPAEGLAATLREQLAGQVKVEHAPTTDKVFSALASLPIGVVVCVFDVQSEADRAFLRALKREHAFILVIAVCDSADTERLVELINHAKVFRFMRTPVSVKMLSLYVNSAVKLLERTRAERRLLLLQEPEPSPAGARWAGESDMAQRVAAVKTPLLRRFATWLKA